MAPPESELKDKAEQATYAAKEFSDLYYDYMDKKRHAIKNLYQDEAKMVWNGHAVTGKGNIIKFLEDLPTSRVSLISLDVQPVSELAMSEQTTIVVTTLGKVQFKDAKPKSFFQTFLLSSQANVWKIISDNYRFMETAASS